MCPNGRNIWYETKIIISKTKIMNTLLVIRGLPGAGKSSLGKLMSDRVYEADDYFIDDSGEYIFNVNKLPEAHAECAKKVEWDMAAQVPIIAVSNTFTREWEMDKYKKLALEYNYRVHYIVVENRHEGVSTHDVPAITMLRMQERFEVKL